MFLIPNKSIIVANQLLITGGEDHQFAETALLALILLEIIFFVLMGLGAFYEKKASSSKLHHMGFMVLIGLRFLLSQLLFLPILDILNFSASCFHYDDGEYSGFMSSYDQRLPCLLSTDQHGISSFLQFLGTFAFLTHILAGLALDYFDFKIRIKKYKNSPK